MKVKCKRRWNFDYMNMLFRQYRSLNLCSLGIDLEGIPIDTKPNCQVLFSPIISNFFIPSFHDTGLIFPQLSNTPSTFNPSASLIQEMQSSSKCSSTIHKGSLYL